MYRPGICTAQLSSGGEVSGTVYGNLVRPILPSQTLLVADHTVDVGSRLHSNGTAQQLHVAAVSNYTGWIVVLAAAFEHSRWRPANCNQEAEL